MKTTAQRILQSLPILIAMVLMPALLVFLFKCGRNEYRQLPYLGIPEGITAKGDTLYHKVPPFKFTDQNGLPYGSEDLKGKIYVADFFFTRCPNICPYLTRNLIKVQENFKDAKGFRIVSFSLDPKYDSVPVLKAYADKYKINNDQWHLLTGPKDSIYTLMNQKGFLVLKPEPNDTPSHFIHTEVMVLVDREGHIRGSYRGTDQKEIERLEDEVRLLYVLYARSKQ